MRTHLRAPKAPPRALLALLPLLALAAAMRESERPYCVQLHLHGSFSEGTGSIDSQSRAANGVVDVLWWSDHDFRITSFHAVSTFDFEDWKVASERGEAWTPLWSRERREQKEIVAHSRARGRLVELTDEDAHDGERSLRVSARAMGRETFRDHLCEFASDRNLQRRPLAADVTLRIAVKPELSGPDARGVIAIELSEHPLPNQERLAVYELRYVLGDEAEPLREKGVYQVPVRCEPGEWNLLELPVTRDVAAGFPEIAGADNALSKLSFGVEIRREGRASVLFDSLAIAHGRPGREMFAAQRELIAEVGKAHPDLVQLQGSEISFLPTHVNEFSLDTDMPDYEALVTEFFAAQEDGDEEGDVRAHVTRRAIEDIHARGGLASYNHMFGAGVEGARPTQTREEVLEELLANRLFGADLLEVGYRDRGGHPLANHLWAWDRLAEHGLFPVGTGVSDSHGVLRAVERTNDMVSWIYATAPTKAALIEGMRRGRVYFGDPDLFDGTLDLVAAGGHRMGSIVVTDAPETTVAIEIDGLEAGDRIHVVGPAPEQHLARGAAFRREVRVPLAGPVDLLRVEVHTAAREAKVLSNPIVFVRDRALVTHLERSGRVR